MLPQRSRHPHRSGERLGMDVQSARASTSQLTSHDAAAYRFHRSRSGDRVWTRTERGAHLSLMNLPIPILHRNTRSMSAVPTKRALVGSDENTPPVRIPLDSNGLGSRKPARLFAAMRRSNSYTKERSGKTLSGRGMFSTPEERSASASPVGSRTASPARITEPPSIAQIAMGLHTSRTPHLGPPHGFLLASDPGARSAAHLHPHSHGRGRATASPSSSLPQTASSSTRVATPLRSSLKKADASRSTSPSASASSSIPSTPRSAFSRLSSAISKSSGRSRLDKFLGRGVKSDVGSVASMNSSEADLGTPRKAVRFVSIVEDEAPQSRTAAVGGVTR